MFLGVEAIDEEGLKLHRKRVSLGKSFEAMEYARSLGINVAVNIIADPSWTRPASSGARLGAVGARDRPSTVNTHILHRDLDHRRSQLHHAQLQALRRAATRAAHEAAAGEILRRADQPSRSCSEAHGLAALRDCASIAAGHLMQPDHFVKEPGKFGSQYDRRETSSWRSSATESRRSPHCPAASRKGEKVKGGATVISEARAGRRMNGRTKSIRGSLSNKGEAGRFGRRHMTTGL